ncbi:MAG: hypothetical protein WBD40_01350 [Tepidisphaeraceae bacterium]
MTTVTTLPTAGLRGRALDEAIEAADANVERLAVARDEAEPGPRYQLASDAHARAIGAFEDLCELRTCRRHDRSRRRAS